MKRLSSLLLAAGLLAAGTTAHALTWQDYDSIVKYMGEGSAHTGEFRILAPVDTYNPAIHHVTSARVGFAFADDASDVAEEVDIWIDLTKIWNNLEVDGTHPAVNFDWHWQNLSGALLGDLQDGILNYKITIQNTSGGYGDTWLKAAWLKAEGGYKQVPDAGATLSLLGLALTLLGAARARRA
jgi:hypothetical protein